MVEQGLHNSQPGDVCHIRTKEDDEAIDAQTQVARETEERLRDRIDKLELEQTRLVAQVQVLQEEVINLNQEKMSLKADIRFRDFRDEEKSKY